MDGHKTSLPEKKKKKEKNQQKSIFYLKYQ